MTSAMRRRKTSSPESDVLTKLTQLKRRNAETRLAQVTLAITALSQQIKAHRDELAKLRQQSVDDPVIDLSQEQKFFMYSLSSIDRLTREKECLSAELAEARHELKRLLHAENMIKSAGGPKK